MQCSCSVNDFEHKIMNKYKTIDHLYSSPKVRLYVHMILFRKRHKGTHYVCSQYMAYSDYLSISHWEMLIVCSPTYLLALVMSCNGFSTPSVRCQARDPAPVFTRFYHPICWAKHQDNSCYCHSGNQEKNWRASDTFVKLFFVIYG